MKPSHEWPQPPSTIKSSSLRRKLTRESLASVDWYKSRRYESYSDGDDDFHTREPLEAACQSSGYGERTEINQSSGSGDYKGFQISAYGKGNHEGFRYGKVQAMQNQGLESVGYGNCKDFQASGYGDGKGFVPKIISSNKEGKANRRVDHSSIVPQQPLRVNAYAFSGAVKLAGKPHTARLIIPAHAAIEENTCFDTREPFSPEVTCLGRVRIKDKQGHETEHSRIEQQTCKPAQRHALESKKQSVDENPKDVTHKGSRKKETAEKRSCLPRRKRRENMELRTLKLFGPSSSAVVPSETVETRRERAALLARSLTSLLEDLRRLEMENSEYVPAVPPPNSLLLMRGFGITNKPWNQELLNENAFQSEENKGTITENSCEDSSAIGIQISDIKMQKSMSMKLTTRVQNFNAAVQSKVSLAQKVFPLSEIESNSLVQNASSSEMNNKRSMDACQQDLALWQRRAIAKLAAIDIKGPMRMELKQPSTK